ncbi:MAG: ELWxxDGT repeat protein, partial [Planctomycetota bacterium]
IRRPPGGATDPSDAQHLTTGHGVTWFVAYDGNTKGLWQTDGTSKGTRLVSSVNVGGRSRPKLAVVDIRLFFNADRVGRGTELWVSDGTTSGTQLVKDIASGPTGESFPEELTPVGGLLYFSAYESQNGRELWRSDGTFAGTFLVKDIFPGKDRPGVAGLPNYSFPKNMVGLGNTLIFQATDGTAGAELWKSDGTTAGTVLVKDIRPGVGGNSKPLGSAPAHLTVFGNEVWFAATDMNLPALWKTDGTTKGTVKMKDIRVKELAVAGTTLFLLTDRELWKASGFGASSVTRVKNISKAQLHNPLAYALTAVGDDVYFIADPTLNANRGTIWKSDGTTAGTAPILDSQNNFVLPLSLGLPGERILVAAGSRKLYFSGGLTASGNREVWVTDGTKAGTRMVHDLWPGSKGSRPSYLTHAHGKLLFVANNGVVGNELWSLEVGGNAQALGPGCQAQGPRPILSASDPVLGGKMTIRYVRGGTSSASVLAIGLPTPGLALTFGACVLPVDFTRLHVLQFLQTDAAGTWVLQPPVPSNTSLKNLYLVLQAAQGPSPTLPFGLDLSNAVYLQPGN